MVNEQKLFSKINHTMQLCGSTGNQLTKVDDAVTEYQPEGYVEPNNTGGFNYAYQYKDHLGNIRLSYADSDNNGTITQNEIIEENNYYPFGLEHKGYNNVVTSTNIAQNYKYNGKELQEEFDLNWYDYGMRMYSPALGRWNAIDPLAEKYYDFSGYSYVKNSPVYLTDILGADIYDRNGKKADISYDKNGGITINNVSDLDADTVSLIIGTFLESSTGLKAIKKLDKKDVRNQLIISDKIGVAKSGDEFGRIVGLTEMDNGKNNIGNYDSRITIFRTDGDFDINNASSNDFSLIDLGDTTNTFTNEEKTQLLDVIRNNFVGIDSHDETRKAFEKVFTKKELNILKRIKKEMIKDPTVFGRITTFIHEIDHAVNNATEPSAFRKEIKSFKKSNNNRN